MVKGHSLPVRPVRIDFRKELSPGIHLLAFKRDFKFDAGQVIGIAMDSDGPRRLYSICSAPADKQVLILFNLVDEGYLTPRLAEAKEGDEIWITEARGEFICREEAAVWIAAGTGVAPFYSMLRSGQAKGKTLIHGARFREQFHFSKDFFEVLGNNYIRCCSGEEAKEFYQGRVTTYLEAHPLPDPSLKYYLCGSAEMVVDTRDILIEKGIPFDHILSEIYF